MNKNNKVIDFHVHLADYLEFRPSALKWFMGNYQSEEEYDSFKEKYKDPKKFCQMLNDNNVEYAVVLAEVAPLTTGIANNSMVEEFCKDNKQLIPFCTFNPFIDANMPELLRELVLYRGFKGVKLYPTYNHFYPNDSKIYPLYAEAQRLDVPIIFHTGSSIFKGSRLKYGNPILYDDIAVDFPNLKIVLAHGGRGVWYDEAFLMIRLHENIYIDVTGLPPHKLLEYFPKMENFSDKFIFGSDWPGTDIGKNIRLFDSLKISEEAKIKILYENAKKLLKLN